MPLIQLTQYSSVQEYLAKINNISIDKIIVSFADEDPKAVFFNRLTYYVITYRGNHFLDKEVEWVASEIKRFIETTKADYEGSVRWGHQWRELYQLETNYFKEFEANNSNPYLSKLKEDYFSWLEKQAHRFSQIYLLEENYIFYDYNFIKIFKDNPKKALINESELSSQIVKLWMQLDNQYQKFLKSFEAIEYPQYNDKADIPNFRWEEFMAPTALASYPKAQREYQKTVFGWLEGQLANRKAKMKWETVPKSYQLITKLMADLQSQLDQSKNKEKKATSQQEKLVKAESSDEYPKHIFSDREAYQIFCNFVAHATKIIQIAFVFRHMSQIENPPLILVKDTPFRNWYNAQTQFSIKLDNTTATYPNSKNADRIIAYKILKNQIF